MNTPWGVAQDIEPILEDMVFVSTAGHGGLHLDAARNRRMPEYLRRRGGWYEEDCEWCLPCVVFEAEILASGDRCLSRAIQQGSHKQTMKNWFPDEYERFFGAVIPPGESHKKDEREFHRVHAQDWLGISAFGDWDKRVPKGYVGVLAKQGGRDGTGPQKFFWVPQDEYDQREEYGFVIDPHRHTEVAFQEQVTKLA